MSRQSAHRWRLLLVTGVIALVAVALVVDRALVQHGSEGGRGYLAYTVGHLLGGGLVGSYTNIRFGDPVTAEDRRVVGTADDELHQFCPSFSPEGNRLAYYEGARTPMPVEGLGVMGEGEHFEQVDLVLAGVGADGGVGLPSLRVPLDSGTALECPVWSPGGDLLALALEEAGGWEVQVFDLSDPLVVEQVLPGARNPAFAPGGSRLYYQATGSLWEAGLDREEIRLLAEVADLAGFSLAPDGSGLAFAGSGDGRADRDIFLLDLATLAVSAVFERPTDDVHPSFAPDGRAVAFVANCLVDDCLPAVGIAPLKPESLPVFLEPPEGCATGGLVVQEVLDRGIIGVAGGQGEPIDCVSTATPEWSPDGRQLAYIGVDFAVVIQPLDRGAAPWVIQHPGDSGPLPIAHLDWQVR